MLHLDEMLNTSLNIQQEESKRCDMSREDWQRWKAKYSSFPPFL
jgi:hypothetical protein